MFSRVDSGMLPYQYSLPFSTLRSRLRSSHSMTVEACIGLVTSPIPNPPVRLCSFAASVSLSVSSLDSSELPSPDSWSIFKSFWSTNSSLNLSAGEFSDSSSSPSADAPDLDSSDSDSSPSISTGESPSISMSSISSLWSKPKSPKP